MGFSQRILRLPRPQTFLYVMSLQTGATVITLSLLLNKVSGLFGLLVVLTGFHLSPFQLSMYIYSVIALALTAFLAPHIRKQSPLQCLALAWFYVVDSVINAAYTAVFAVTWFMFISQHENSSPTRGPGSSTMNDAAGFTNPKYNVSSVQVDPVSDAASAQPADAPAGTSGDSEGVPSLGNGVLQPESLQSIGIICTLWTIRVYFVLVMLSFARQCLRQHALSRLTSTTSRPGSIIHSRNPSAVSSLHSRSSSLISNIALEMDPFATKYPEGQGWKGKLGRAMISFPRSYWLDSDNDDGSWIIGMNRKFRRRRDVGGIGERERRRRAGTGPPPPSKDVLNSVGFAAGGQGPYQSQGSSVAGGIPVVVYDFPVEQREREV
ncbi:hypothetical protein VTO42DRAFT_4580 [Malbranchea cinnamomea]